jgi:hypothetical protein
MCIGPDTKVARAREHLSSEVAGDTVILHLQTGQYYSLNGSASSLWRHLEMPITVRELIAKQEQEYDAAPAVVEKDAIALLLKLRDAGLIQTEDECTSGK